MPHAVVVLSLSRKGDHANGISKAAQKDQKKQRPIILIKIGQKHQSAPANDKIQRKVEGPPLAGAKDRHQRHTKEDHAPLHAEKRDAKTVAQINQQHRGKGSANEQVDGAVIQSAADPFHRGARGHGMVHAAGKHHNDHADAVKTGGGQLQRCIRLQKQQHKAGNGKACANAVADRVDDLLPH